MTFVVYGSPATKGSTVSFMGHHGIVTKTDSKGLASWSQAVGWGARLAKVERAPSGTPVHLKVTFQFVRPRGQKRRTYPIVRPDLDKILRALLDALTGVAYDDDAQVVALDAIKIYGTDARTTIQVAPL